MSSNHFILCCPLLLLPSIFPNIRVLSNESALRMRWPKYWSFSFNISPSNEHPELISFRMDWLDLLAIQGTLKSLLQHHSSKASILQRSAFFIVQLSHPYMTTGKTIASYRWNFVGKVMSLLFNMLSWLVITFLPRSKSLNFMAAVIICSDFGAQKNKVSYGLHCFSIYLPWSDGTGCHDLSFLMLSFKPTFSRSSFTFIKNENAPNMAAPQYIRQILTDIKEEIDSNTVTVDRSLTPHLCQWTYSNRKLIRKHRP